MAKPDATRKMQLRRCRCTMPAWAPVASAMAHANTTTTLVRTGGREVRIHLGHAQLGQQRGCRCEYRRQQCPPKPIHRHSLCRPFAGRVCLLRWPPMRVLIVEDEVRLAENIARGLHEGSGYAIDVAHDGEEGMTFCWTGKYDLIVLDLMLPNRGGRKYFEPAARRKGRDAGADPDRDCRHAPQD